MGELCFFLYFERKRVRYVSRERVAVCVSTWKCYSKNDNKDTNGSKGSIFWIDLGYTASSDPPLPFSSGGGWLMDFGALGKDPNKAKLPHTFCAMHNR